jgi:hypothetical protein
MAIGKSSRKRPRSRHPADITARTAVCVTLRTLIRELNTALAVIITTVGALDAQHADGDAWIAITLRRYAGDALDREIKRVQGLIAELE